jgi:hypothetical protein
VSIEHSRALLLGEQATGTSQSRLERRLDDSVVVISGDRDLPMSALTIRVLVTTLRRGLGTLVLVRGGLSAGLVETLEAAAFAIDPTRPLRVTKSLDVDPTAWVHLGTSAPGGVIRVVPDGYGAHVAGARTAVIRPQRPGNALGAVYSAALGATEIFKHTAGVIVGRRVLHRHLRFCPVSLSCDLSGAPALPDAITMELALIGVGAIGTGIALILSELPVGGRLLAVDRQRFAPENRSSYSLGGLAEAEARPSKVDLARSALGRFEVVAYTNPVTELVRAVDDGEMPWCSTVLTALDSAEARRDAQRLWPDRLIDAATGDTMLGLCDHRYGSDPCMTCVFPIRRDQPFGVERLARRLGLPVDVLAQGDTPLTEDHLRDLTDDQRRMLEPHLGTLICGLANATGLTEMDANGFMPSVAFVSLQAACLAVGRLLAGHIGLSPAPNFVQYDGLIGPQTATVETMKRRPGCACDTRSDAIAAVRKDRRKRMRDHRAWPTPG